MFVCADIPVNTPSWVEVLVFPAQNEEITKSCIPVLVPVGLMNFQVISLAQTFVRTAQHGLLLIWSDASVQLFGYFWCCCGELISVFNQLMDWRERTLIASLHHHGDQNLLQVTRLLRPSFTLSYGLERPTKLLLGQAGISLPFQVTFLQLFSFSKPILMPQIQLACLHFWWR